VSSQTLSSIRLSILIYVLEILNNLSKHYVSSASRRRWPFAAFVSGALWRREMKTDSGNTTRWWRSVWCGQLCRKHCHCRAISHSVTHPVSLKTILTRVVRRCYSYRNSVRLSVRLSHWWCTPKRFNILKYHVHHTTVVFLLLGQI